MDWLLRQKKKGLTNPSGGTRAHGGHAFSDEFFDLIWSEGALYQMGLSTD